MRRGDGVRKEEPCARITCSPTRVRLLNYRAWGQQRAKACAFPSPLVSQYSSNSIGLARTAMAPSPATEASLHGQIGFGHGERARSDGGEAAIHAKLRQLLLATHHVHITTLALILSLLVLCLIASIRQQRISPSSTWTLRSPRRRQYWPLRKPFRSSKGGAAGPGFLTTSTREIPGDQALDMARQEKKEKEEEKKQQPGPESRNPLRPRPRTPTPHTGPSATVHLAQGRYTGVLLPASFAVPRAVEAWRGIPFAQATGGQNRFRPPAPLHLSASSAATPFDASAFGPVCPGTAARIPGMLDGEDCLNLNVYRPASSYEPGGARMPVVVYVHGGAFNGGLGTERDMSSFVGWSQTPIVGVNFNYRVGALGFPSSAVAEREGALNLGLRDQRLLFEWVRQNIGQFGGDESRVTLMGMSAGAHSVSLAPVVDCLPGLRGWRWMPYPGISPLHVTTNMFYGSWPGWQYLFRHACLVNITVTHANTGSDRLPPTIIHIRRCPLPPRNNGVWGRHRACNTVSISSADPGAVQRIPPRGRDRAHPYARGSDLPHPTLAAAGNNPLRVQHRLLAVPGPDPLALPARRRVLPVRCPRGRRQRRRHPRPPHQPLPPGQPPQDPRAGGLQHQRGHRVRVPARRHRRRVPRQVRRHGPRPERGGPRRAGEAVPGPRH